jgi:hypothetical protein
MFEHATVIGSEREWEVRPIEKIERAELRRRRGDRWEKALKARSRRDDAPNPLPEIRRRN